MLCKVLSTGYRVTDVARNPCRVQPFGVLRVFQSSVQLHTIVEVVHITVPLAVLIVLLNTIVRHTVDF